MTVEQLQTGAASSASPKNTGKLNADALNEKVRSLRLSPGVQSHGGGTARLAWVLVVLLAASTGVLGYAVATQKPVAVEEDAETETAATTNDTSALKSPAAAPAASAQPQMEAGTIALESKGYMIPAHQILVSPKVSGMVVKLYVEEGKRVEKNAVLAEIESTDYQSDVNRAQGALHSAQQKLLELENGNRPEEIKQAEAELREWETQLVQLEAETKRSVQLRKNNAITQEDFESKESQAMAMKNRVERQRLIVRLMHDGPRKEKIEAAQADVKVATAELAKAQWRLDNCKVRAPISGTILKKNAEEGNIVNAIAFNGSFSLCEMADLSDLEVDLTIQERDVSRIHKGQLCKIKAEAYPDREYNGVVSRLMPIADRSKGAIPVRVKVSIPTEEEGVYLKPEMGVIVSFLNAKKPDAEAKAAVQKPEAASIASGSPPPKSKTE